MEQEWQHPAAVFSVANVALFGAGAAFHHGIHGFQVGGVGRKIDPHLGARQIAHHLVSKVVFHVAVASHQVGDIVGAEFMQQDLERLLQVGGEDGKASAVGHAHHDVLHPMFRGVVEDGIEHHHGAFAAFDGEALLPLVFGVQELFEGLGFPDPAEEALLLRGGGRGEVDPFFDPFPQPLAHFVVQDVHELEASQVAVGAAQPVHHFPQLGALAVVEEEGFDFGTQICFGQAEFLQRQAGLLGSGGAEGIKMGADMADRPVGFDHPGDAGAEGHFLLAHAAAGRFGGGRGCLGLGGAQFEALKKRRPCAIHGLGILEPKLILLL